MTHHIPGMDNPLFYLRNPDVALGDLFIPWPFVIGFVGCVVAWAIVTLMEHLGWTRYVWHLPLFFVALSVLIGSTLGILLAP